MHLCWLFPLPGILFLLFFAGLGLCQLGLICHLLRAPQSLAKQKQPLILPQSFSIISWESLYFFYIFPWFFKNKNLLFFFFHFLNMMIHFNITLILFYTHPGPIWIHFTNWADTFLLLLPPSPWESLKQSNLSPTIILLPLRVHRCIFRSPWKCASF